MGGRGEQERLDFAGGVAVSGARTRVCPAPATSGVDERVFRRDPVGDLQGSGRTGTCTTATTAAGVDTTRRIRRRRSSVSPDPRLNETLTRRDFGFLGDLFADDRRQVAVVVRPVNVQAGVARRTRSAQGGDRRPATVDDPEHFGQPGRRDHAGIVGRDLIRPDAGDGRRAMARGRRRRNVGDRAAASAGGDANGRRRQFVERSEPGERRHGRDRTARPRSRTGRLRRGPVRRHGRGRLRRPAVGVVGVVGLVVGSSSGSSGVVGAGGADGAGERAAVGGQQIATPVRTRRRVGRTDDRSPSDDVGTSASIDT